MLQSLPAAASAALCALTLMPAALPQEAPLRGPRHVDPRWHALVGATLIPEPGERIEDATIVLRDGVIESIAVGTDAPAGARVWNCEGLIVHAGFIESHVGVATPKPDGDALGGHWHTEMAVPDRSALDGERLSEAVRGELRSLGFTAAAIAPEDGVLRGTAALVALAKGATDTQAAEREVVQDGVYQAMSFQTAGWGSDGVLRYPTSEMGAIALARQAFIDADRYARCLAVDTADASGHEAVQPNRSMEALLDTSAPLVFVAGSELQTLRAVRMAAEFDRTLIALGTGTEFRRLDAIAAAGIPMIIPVAFPDAPDVSTPEKADGYSLRDLAGWEQAPTNARRLVNAGVTIALTTDRLEKRADFAKNLRSAIEHGLDADEALRALTTTPAGLLGAEDRVGRVRAGMLAHLVVREGEPFAKDGKVRDVWVAGRRHVINKPSPPKIDGRYAFEIARLGGREDVTGVLVIQDRKKLTFELDGETIEAQKPKFGPRHVHFHLAGADLGADGVYSGSALIERDAIHGTLTSPDGSSVFWSAVAVPEEPGEDPQSDASEEAATLLEDVTNGLEDMASLGLDNGAGNGQGVNASVVPTTGFFFDDGDSGEATIQDDEDASETDAETDLDPATSDVPEALPLPFGAYGRLDTPEQRTVVFHGATLWTGGEGGIVENGVVVIENGRVVYAGATDGAPKTSGADSFDATGLHITPGLIDCHSHTGISGGVNEVGRRVTSEVRIADVIDPDDISFYRQLAGGLTAANQLHGSANAIGGQNSVVKLRWGARHADDMRLLGAMGGIKFALGENPKRVASGNEYPQTRMGVEALIRDRLTAGKEYRAAWERYDGLSSWEKRSTMPPKRDLELEALGEIVHGERLIHCHSYRQDEILMLARIAQEFGFKIGTFQHVLEGYKVADAVAEAALGASTFSDWWAYKFEVIDAIPHNAAIMAEVGVNVSINSDSDEHARRLNTEAAKAVKYGGMDPHEALKLVTLNPAIQLGVGDRVGSLEAGKDADLAIWSGSPLSYASRCVSTWIDGREMFSAEEDAQLRATAESERQRIIQKLLAQSVKASKKKGKGGSDDAEATPTSPATGPESRDLAAMRDEMEALWRSGVDPSLSRPGVCGCFDVLFEEARARAQRR